MEEENIEAAKSVPSYLVECLVWNVPDPNFGHADIYYDVRESFAHLFNNTIKFDDCKEWGRGQRIEVSLLARAAMDA